VTHDLDLEAYLARIGYTGQLDPTVETLRALHRAHVGAIPFENLDIHLGRPILLDLDSLQRKMVRDRRGGYCFEQNTLFAAVLRAIGFELTTLAARVRFGSRTTGSRTHMVATVSAEGGSWLSDVGFGGDGLLEPVAFGDDRPVTQGAWTFRLDAEDELFVLRTIRSDRWTDLYAFDLQPQLPVDYEVANHFTSTWPGSPFVSQITAQLTCPAERLVLRGSTFTVERATGEEREDVGDPERLLEVLAVRFGLVFPAGTRFASPRER
jgi:N-hydroxyarylamine O-acetyltransferase